MFGCSIKGVKALTVLSVRIGAPIEQVISEVRVPRYVLYYISLNLVSKFSEIPSRYMKNINGTWPRRLDQLFISKFTTSSSA